MTDLEERLRAARNCRLKLVVTDGVFSMEGDVAKLPDIVALSRQYDAIVAVDDSHGSGVLGAHGRGVAEHHAMLGDVDIITSTLAKAIQMSELLLAEGVFVTGFGYPVVPQGHARVRCQLSAAHTRDDLDFALRAFQKVGRELRLI